MFVFSAILKTTTTKTQKTNKNKKQTNKKQKKTNKQENLESKKKSIKRKMEILSSVNHLHALHMIIYRLPALLQIHHKQVW